jgi:hypothetical protein
MGGAGIQTAAIAFGGAPPPAGTGATELYDGTSWTTSPATLVTSRSLAVGDAGTQTAALGFGGYNGTSVLNATEEFIGAGAAVTKTITVS